METLAEETEGVFLFLQCCKASNIHLEATRTVLRISYKDKKGHLSWKNLYRIEDLARLASTLQPVASLPFLHTPLAMEHHNQAPTLCDSLGNKENNEQEESKVSGKCTHPVAASLFSKLDTKIFPFHIS